MTDLDVPAGHLYLGEGLDATSRERDGEAVMLEAADLTTHGVLVGMTGSGKTGLGVVMLEEALLQGIPTLVLDPKGDLGNLLLTFPDLAADDFAPWVEGADPAAVATQWRDGLAGWGIGPDRIRALRDAADYTIYTPGSTAGVPLNIVGSLRRPADGAEPETTADEVEGFVSGLLDMVGVASDPLSGREHILLTNLIETAWAAGRDLDLPTLVGQVQDPPLRKVGVFELDAFYPPAERTELAMTLNGLLASRAFAAWAEGPDLDIDGLLRPPAAGGKPACAIVGLAHLSDEERQFVVSLVLGKLITWMRRQPGTDKLRVLVYFDEVMGFVPPNGEPPAKKPLLTLFKQARAFGVGLVLATQNPVDVDYKGLSNAGTWMIGRLQTEQDKARLLDGLAVAGADVSTLSDTIGALGKREFLLREPGGEPSLFTSRWAMSYLRGPLTREQVRTLMAGKAATMAPTPAAAEAPVPQTAAAPAAAPTPAGATGTGTGTVATADGGADADTVPLMPQVAEGVPVRWLDPAATWAPTVGAVPGGTRFAPALVARVALVYDETKLDLRHTEEWEAVAFPLTPTLDAAAFTAVDYDDRDLRPEAPAGAAYTIGDAPLGDKRFVAGAQKALVDHLVGNRPLQVQRNAKLGLASRVGETPEQFAARCRAAAEDAADDAQATLTRTYETRLTKARDALETASDRVAQAERTQDTRRGDTLVRGAGSLLGAVLGGRRNARSMARDMGMVLGSGGRSREAAQRVQTAQNRVRDRQEALEELEADLAEELAAIDAEAADDAAAVDTVDVPLEKTDVRVTAFSVVWVPVA